jgi:GTP1/Obg family GTP-binding protein
LPILLIDHPLANRTPDEIDAIALQRLVDAVQFLMDAPTQSA